MPGLRSGRLVEAVESWAEDGARIVLASDQAARLSELLGEAGRPVAAVVGVDAAPPPGAVALVERSLNGGFIGGPDRIAFVTDRELFGTVRVRRPKAMRRVVPRDILERLTPGRPRRPHRSRDRPLRADAPARRDRARSATTSSSGSVATTGSTSRSSRSPGSPLLGRRAADAEPARRDRLAADEAARQEGGRRPGRGAAGALRGPRPTPAAMRSAPTRRGRARWRRRFPYEETVDQLRAVAEAKPDMEAGRPMDRLVVGDVGYGKTEVALRAAFKAIQDGKQVAVLVPTTVLAAQHFQTFSQRFAAFPMTVRLLSRFVPPHDQAATLEGLAERLGRPRHRDPPAAVEGRPVPRPRPRRRRRGAALRRRREGAAQAAAQRGRRADPVRHADPAHAQPRPGRHPRPQRHRDAAGGSAADPDPRRRGIGRARPRRDPARARPRRAGLLRPQPGRDDRGPGGAAAPAAARRPVRRRARPDGRGRAREGDDRVRGRRRRRPRLHDDHRVRARHPEREHDRHRPRRHARAGPALPAPRARRPVGAGGPTRTCSTGAASGCRDEARKRLQAIFNASELGAGFQIALSDLEIRGAGNILGGEQSGHMAAVGFDLYSRLLAEAVEEQKARPRVARRSSRRRRPWSTCRSRPACPTTYVPDEAQKLELYRRLARARTAGDLAAFRQEVIDRFGPMPHAGPPARRGRGAAPVGRGGRRRLDLARGGPDGRPLRARRCRGRRRCGSSATADCPA